MVVGSCSIATQRTQGFLDRFAERAPSFAKQIDQNLAVNRELFCELSEPLLEWAARLLGESYEDVLIDGYCSFVIDVNRSQLRYERTRRYQHQRYEQVFTSTYDSADFMKLYHWGVYVTTFAWKHHLDVYRFFRDEFLARLARLPSGELLDLGCGSGVWHMIALRRLAHWKVTAVDISQTSVRLSRRMAETAGLAPAVTHLCDDALRFQSDRRVDAGISCFLLEHLERPGELLANLAPQIKEHGYAFVTCALSAAETDHIYEFLRESQVVVLAEEAGFRVVSMLSSSPESHPKKNYFLPRSMAMLLQKRAGDIW